VSRHTGDVSIRTDGKQRFMVVTENGVEHEYPLEPKAKPSKRKTIKAGELLAEETRNYRLVEIQEGKKQSRREEIEMDGDRWIQRGSDATRAGSVMEEAAKRQADAKLAEDKAKAVKAKQYFDYRHLPGNRGGGGFDDVIVEFTPPKKNPKALVRVREVKDYPDRYVPVAEFSSIRGPGLVENVKNLRDRVESAILALEATGKAKPEIPKGFEDLTLEQLEAIQRTIDAGELQFEIVLSDKTKIGTENTDGATVLAELRTGVAGRGTLKLEGGKPERVDAKWVKQAEAAKKQEEKEMVKKGGGK